MASRVRATTGGQSFTSEYVEILLNNNRPSVSRVHMQALLGSADSTLFKMYPLRWDRVIIGDQSFIRGYIGKHLLKSSSQQQQGQD